MNDFLFLWFINFFGTVPIINISINLLANIFFALWVIFFIFFLIKSKERYKKSFLKKHCVYNIWGKPWSGKTRIISTIMRDISLYNNNTFCISNYMNWYSSIFFSSKNDFFYIQRDIAILSLYLNFTEDEKIEIQKKFPKYFKISKDLEKKLKKIKEKYKWNVNFITTVDEAHLYFYNRNFMKNFAWENWAELLSLIHQTRHSNQLLILATQDTDSLDLDFRTIAEKEIEVKSYIGWIFYGFNTFSYLSEKYRWETEKKYKKNKEFNFFFNSYIFFVLNEKINEFLNKIFKKMKIKKEFSKNLFKKLDYNTKFNVNININIYKEWQIFDFLLDK